MKKAIIGSIAAIAIGLTGCSATGGAGSVPTTMPSPIVWTPPPATQEPYYPDATDFDLFVTITSKQCFGPYSCIYTYAVTARYTATTQRPLPTVTLTYTVIGGDQSAIDSITFVPNANGYTNPRTVVAMASDGVTFAARPTQVMWR